MQSTIVKAMLLLASELDEANIFYYLEDSPKMSDTDYDSKFRELLNLEKAHPELIQPNTPTRKVGGKIISGHEKVRHTIPMLSLANVFDLEDIKVFIRTVVVYERKTNFYIDQKMDGIATELTYELGILTDAVTRGDGKEGERVLHNAETIITIPKSISGLMNVPLFKIRGEVVMPIAAFIRFNELAALKGNKTFVNPRNAAAGAMRRLDSSLCGKCNLAFYAYGSPTINGSFSSHEDVMLYMSELGFLIPEYTVVDDSCEYAIMESLDEFEKNRNTSGYDIDGAVIKVNNLSLQDEMGLKTTEPAWACSYKFKAQEVTSVITDVVYQVGRTGKITPVVKVEPVFVCGVTVSSITCSNLSELLNKGVKIGATCFITRRGDVIPALESVVVDEDIPPLDIPERCPCCNSLLKIVSSKTSMSQFCVNDNCKDRRISTLTYLAGRKVLYIKGLGESVSRGLIEGDLIQQPSDIFKLTVDQLVTHGVTGEANAVKLIDEIGKLKASLTLEKVLILLCIPGVSSTNASMLSNWADGDISKFFKSTYSDFLTIDGAGEVLSNALVDKFATEGDEFLSELYCSPERYLVPEIKKKDTLKGIRIIFTGSFNTIKRSDEEKLIKAHGGVIPSTFNKETWLVKGTGGGGKIAKAEAAGSVILDEDTYLSIKAEQFNWVKFVNHEIEEAELMEEKKSPDDIIIHV